MELQITNIIALVLLTLVIIAVVSLIIVAIGEQIKKQIFSKTKDITGNFSSSAYNICEAYNGKYVSLQDFQLILQSVSQGNCQDVHANISLSFSLSKQDITKIIKTAEIIQDEKLIFYNINESIGVGGVIIQGHPGYYPLKTYDVVEVWRAGKPAPDIFINVTIKS